jgi:hypothetical protein
VELDGRTNDSSPKLTLPFKQPKVSHTNRLLDCDIAGTMFLVRYHSSTTTLVVKSVTEKVVVSFPNQI